MHPTPHPTKCLEPSPTSAGPELSERRLVEPPAASRAQPSVKSRFSEAAHYRQHLGAGFEETAEGFRAWRGAYDAARAPSDDSLSEGVADKVVAFLLRGEVGPKLFPPLALRHPERCEAALDAFTEYSEERGLSADTTELRLRYLKWYTTFLLCCAPLEHRDAVWSLVGETLHEFTGKRGIARCNDGILAISDPLPKASLAEQLAGLLRRYQTDVLDPFLRAHYATGHSPADRIAFGKAHLRQWLALALRVWNVPCRVQLDIHLDAPSLHDTDEYVARLQPTSAGTYLRVVNRDKVAGFQQAVAIPVDAVLSLYLFYYLRHCRAQPEARHVFQTKRGAPWTRASRDLKAWLEAQGVPCAQLCPNHRFVHHLRHVGLAVFALRHDFDEQKIREYATLMRHSLDTIEKYYCSFLKYQVARRAIRSLERVAGRPLPLSDADSAASAALSYLDPRPGALDPPDAVAAPLRAEFRATFRNQFAASGEFPVPYYRTRDAATQTYAAGAEEEADVVATSSATSGTCVRCGAEFTVFGPWAQKTSEHYGKFYAACATCTPHASVRTAAVVYQLGFVPAQRSASSLPRNLDAVRQYVRDQLRQPHFDFGPLGRAAKGTAK